MRPSWSAGFVLVLALALALAAIYFEAGFDGGRGLSLEVCYRPFLKGVEVWFELRVRVLTSGGEVGDAIVFIDGLPAHVDGSEGVEVRAGMHCFLVAVGDELYLATLPVYFPDVEPLVNCSQFYDPPIPVVAAYYACFGDHSVGWRKWGDPRRPSAAYIPFLAQVSGGFLDQGLGLYGLGGEGGRGLIKRQMVLARMSGVSAFAVSWWGPGSFEDQYLDEILDVAEEVGLKVTVIVEPFHGFDEERLEEAADYLRSRYMDRPAWLRDPDGLPVVFTFNIGRPEEWAKWCFLKQRREAWVAHTTDRRALKYGFKYLYEYSPVGIKIRGLNVTEVYDAASAGGFFIPTLTPRYNDTGFRRPGHAFKDLWVETCEATRFVVERRSPPFIFVTSWNEWLEGTSVEPSMDQGFAYLVKLRRFLGGSELKVEDFLRALRLDDPPVTTLKSPLTPLDGAPSG